MHKTLNAASRVHISAEIGLGETRKAGIALQEPERPKAIGVLIRQVLSMYDV